MRSSPGACRTSPLTGASDMKMRFPTEQEDPSGQHLPIALLNGHWCCVHDGEEWPCPYLIGYETTPATRPTIHKCKRCGADTVDYDEAARCFDSHTFTGRSVLDSYDVV